MDKNRCWEQIKDIFNHLDRTEREERVSCFVLVGRMIQSFPPILAENPCLEELPEMKQRTRAFSSYVLCQTLQFQSNLEYSEWDTEIYALQTIMFETLRTHDKKRWKYFMEELLRFALCLSIILRRMEKCEDSPAVLSQIITRKEMDKLGRFIKENECRILEDQEPEDSIFSNCVRLVSTRIQDSTRRLLFSLNRILLNNIQTISACIRRHELTIRKFCLIQMSLKDVELKTQSLQLISSIFNPRETNIKLVSMETKLVLQIFQLLHESEKLMTVTESQISRISSAMFQFLKNWVGLETNSSLTILLRSTVYQSVLSFIDTDWFQKLEEDKQNIIFQFLISLLDDAEELGEKERLSVLRCGLSLQDEKPLIRFSWREINCFTQIPSRSEKRKHEDSEEPRFNFLLSKSWLDSLEFLRDLLNRDLNLESCLSTCNIILKAGTVLLLRCKEKWPGLSYLVLDPATVSSIVSLLLRSLETGPEPSLFQEYFNLINYLILLLNACKNYSEINSSLHLLAGILALPYTSELAQLDLKLGKSLSVLTAVKPGLNPGEGRMVYQYQGLYYLSLLPKDVAPKWRLLVFKQALSKTPEYVVRCVPNLVCILGTNCTALALDVISRLNKQTNKMFTEEISRYAGLLVCSLARGVELELTGVKDEIREKDEFSRKDCFEMNISGTDSSGVVFSGTDCSGEGFPDVSEEPGLTPVCRKCHGQIKHKGGNVEFNSIQPLFKLIGHQDPEIRRSLLSLIVPFCSHSSLSNSAAMLLLTYTEDSEYLIRWIFSNKIRFLMECECSTLEGRDQVSSNIINRLLGMKPSRDEDWNTYIPTLVSIQQCVLPLNSQREVLKKLLSLFFSLHTHKTSFIYSLTVLQDQLRKEKTFVLHWVSEKICSRGEEPEVILMYLDLLVPAEEKDSFIILNLHHILPTVFYLSAIKDLKAPLVTLAGLKRMRPKALINEYFPKMYAHLVINSDKDKLAACMRYMKRETGIELKVLITSYRLKVIEELLCVLSYDREKVTHALRDCARADEMFKNKGNGDQNVVKEYLSHNLMAALSFFLTKLNNEGTSVKTKLDILASLSELCSFLGSDHLSPVKHSLLACLKISGNLSRKSASFNTVSVSLWNAFVRNIELNDLEVILPQVLVGLAYHVTLDKEKIVPLFRYLLVENRKKFKDLSSYMVLLPDRADLKDIVVQVRGAKVEFRNILIGILKNIDHEAVEVRHQTLNTLRNLLDVNMGALQGLLLRTDQTDSVVSELVQKLMNGMSSHEPDEDLRYVSADCIGRIGALDPGRIEIAPDTSANSVEIQNFLLDVNSADFCVRLIMELVRACQSSREPFIVDNCMFSIQQVLKIYQINEKEKNMFAVEVMKRLSDSAREIVSPLLRSMYVHTPKPQQKIKTPVYGSILGRNYKDWLVNLTQCLIEHIYDPKIKDIFSSCLPALKKDVRTAEFLLPHIVVSVICGAGDEEIEILVKEVNAILPEDGDASLDDGQDRYVEENTDKLVAQTLFSILDHLRSWLRAKYNMSISSLGKSDNQLRTEDILKATKEKHYQAVLSFINRIPDEGLANLSFYTGAYHRSAFYLDRTFVNQEYSEHQLNAMQKLFACLQEPDLVVGVAAVRREEPTLENQILYNQAIGNFQDALCCFERQRRAENVGYTGLIQCYLYTDKPSAAASLAAGLIAKDKSLSKYLAPFQAEAAWQLGEWQELNEFTKEEFSPEPSWEMNLSKVILSAYKMDKFLFLQESHSSRKDILKTLSAVSSEQSAYKKSYLYIGRLGMLQEVQNITETLLLNKPGDTEVLYSRLCSLLEDLEARLNYTQVSWTNMEPILRLRRGIFNAVYSRCKPTEAMVRERVKTEIGECWLRSAKIARKAGQLQESYSFLLEAEKYENPQIFLESAKLKWERGNKTEAISALKKGLNDAFPDVMNALEKLSSKDDKDLQISLTNLDRKGPGLRELCASGKLLLARYVEEAASVGQEAVRTHFEHAKEILRTSDEIFYYQAKFMDKKSMKMTSEQMINQSEIVTHAALTYLRSLRYGPTFLDECMPRLLSIWLDFAATIQEAIVAKSRDTLTIAVVDHATKQLSKLNRTIQNTISKMPTYYFLTAFPQIVSRICHSNNETYNVLKSLMVKVVLAFPQQAFWHLVCVSKNRDPTRKSRCQEVFAEVKRVRSDLSKFLTDAILFSEKIDDLCDVKTAQGVLHTSCRELVPSLPALFRSKGFSSIILPIERNMVVTSPTSEADLETHNPYPDGVVTIVGIEDDIQVMISLIKPKKITLRGSDGKRYSFLAKPKDDLRRDCRLMDFGNLLNRMFRKEPETRKRGLKMRTYMVVPTNETNGLIEWVSNLKGLRHIIITLLKERGVSVQKIQRQHMPKNEDSVEKKIEGLRKCINDMKGNHSSPSVFREWFVRTFPDPQAWFAARLAFTRTTAVMSMMGYILGLGDRHLENINVDTTTGQTFHVDMNSLFNISETYAVPEIVPFRLTNNIVDGFGPLGTEGPFRISCEVTLRMMRDQKDLLMSVLRPFIFDPLVDWTIRDKSKKKEVGGDEGNKPGKEALARVQDRLDGCVTTDRKRKGNLNPPLSVEGQVDHVIREASTEKNLAVMYWGWNPFL